MDINKYATKFFSKLGKRKMIQTEEDVERLSGEEVIKLYERHLDKLDFIQQRVAAVQAEADEKYGTFPEKVIEALMRRVVEEIQSATGKIVRTKRFIYSIVERVRSGKVRYVEVVEFLKAKYKILDSDIELAKQRSIHQLEPYIEIKREPVSPKKKVSSYSFHSQMLTKRADAYQELKAMLQWLIDLNKDLEKVEQGYRALYNDVNAMSEKPVSYERYPQAYEGRQPLAATSQRKKVSEVKADEDLEKAFLVSGADIVPGLKEQIVGKGTLFRSPEMEQVWRKANKDREKYGFFPLQAGDIVLCPDGRVRGVTDVDFKNNIVRVKGANRFDVADFVIDQVVLQENMGSRRKLAKRAIKKQEWDKSYDSPWWKIEEENGRYILKEVTNEQ